jgi:hypothetical protein
MPTPDPEPVAPVSPRAVLDDKKRRQIIALLANGSSRRMAARFVGCAASTITRTAMREPEFAQQLITAEQNADIDALRALRAAASKDRYWRAAAWLLERRNPEEFARRPLHLFTADRIAQMMAQIAEVLDKDLPEENYQRVMAKITQLVEQCREESQALQWQPSHGADEPPPVQHPSSEASEVAIPTLAAIPEPACTSEVQH